MHISKCVNVRTVNYQASYALVQNAMMIEETCHCWGT